MEKLPEEIMTEEQIKASELRENARKDLPQVMKRVSELTADDEGFVRTPGTEESEETLDEEHGTDANSTK